VLGLLLKRPGPVSFNCPNGYDPNETPKIVDDFKPRNILTLKTIYYLQAGDILMRIKPRHEWAKIKEILHDGSFRFFGFDVPRECIRSMVHMEVVLNVIPGLSLNEEKFVVYGGFKDV